MANTHEHSTVHHDHYNTKVDFTFPTSAKTLLLGGVLLGVISLALTYFMFDDELHTRFWTNFLHNSVFFTGIAFISLFIYCAFTTAFAGWHTVMKRIWEAYAQFLIVGLGLMLVMVAGTYFHWHHLYHWADTSVLDPNNENYDYILAGKAGFLNIGWYSIGTIVVLSIWYFFAAKIRSLSLDEDRNGTKDWGHHLTIQKWAAVFLPIAGFTSCAMIWQWIMSIDSHWYSTMFAWYATASWACAAFSLTILTIIYLKSLGYFQNLTDEHFHDLGKYLFAFSIFWTYLWFSQYMLIWYSNNGEETTYFYTRVHMYPVLWYANLAVNFVLPFFVLLRNSTKRKYGTLIFASVMVFIGHWWDYFMMIKPGAFHGAQEHLAHAHGDGHGHHEAAHGHDHAHDVAHSATDHAHDLAHAAGEHGHAVEAGFEAGFTIPMFLEIGTFIGFLSLFLFLALRQLTKASLEPRKDPYYEESLHHHV